MEKFKKFGLQMFADDGGAGGEHADPTGKQSNEPGTEPQEDPKAQPKYSDKDLDRIISRKIAEERKRQEKEVEQEKAKGAEAARLAQMTAEEKANERIRALEEKLAAADREKEVAAMTKQARAILSDKGIHVDDALLANLISDNADSTKASVESFVSLFQAAVEKAVKDKVKGEPPKAGGTPSLTKEQIMAVTNRAERQRLMAENKHLF